MRFYISFNIFVFWKQDHLHWLSIIFPGSTGNYCLIFERIQLLILPKFIEIFLRFVLAQNYANVQQRDHKPSIINALSHDTELSTRLFNTFTTDGSNWRALCCFMLEFSIHLWPLCVADADIIFLSCGFFLLFYFSPNLNGRRLDVYHTSTHGVALVRI